MTDREFKAMLRVIQRKQGHTNPVYDRTPSWRDYQIPPSEEKVIGLDGEPVDLEDC